MQKKQKAQGAIEYLLIIGVAILITAIVIIAVTSIINQGKNQDKASLDSADSSYRGIYDIIDTMQNSVRAKIILFSGPNNITIPQNPLDPSPTQIIAPQIFFSNPAEGTQLSNLPCPVTSSTFTSGAWAPSIDSCNLTAGDEITITVPKGGTPTELTLAMDNSKPPEAIFFDGGSGTEEDPFEVNTFEQLQNVDYALDKNFVLTSNVDATGGDFVPIGSKKGAPFTGKFNGNGHYLKLDINSEKIREKFPSSMKYYGLFAQLGSDNPSGGAAKVENLSIKESEMNIYVTSELMALPSIEQYAGFLSGKVIDGKAVVSNVSLINNSSKIIVNFEHTFDSLAPNQELVRLGCLYPETAPGSLLPPCKNQGSVRVKLSLFGVVKKDVDLSSLSPATCNGFVIRKGPAMGQPFEDSYDVACR